MFLEYIILIFVLFAFTYIYYSITSVNVSKTIKHNQFRRLLRASIFALLPLYISETQFQPYLYGSSIIVALFLLMTEAGIAKIVKGKHIISLSSHLPIAVGLYSFCALASLQLVIASLINNYGSKDLDSYYILSSLILTVIQFIIVLPQIFSIIYFAIFKSEVTKNTFMLIFQTHKKECKDYLKSISPWVYIVLSAGCTCLVILLYELNMYMFRNMHNITLYQGICLGILTILMTVYSSKRFMATSNLVENFKQVKSYFYQLTLFKETHDRSLANLILEQTSKPRNIVLIVGESASRDYMSSFTTMVERTTPWFDIQKSNPNFYFFHTAYACANSTVPALSRAFTSANYYNNMPFDQSISIVDIAKKAGYKTHWYSNQGKIGLYDTPVTMIAETADVSKWTIEEFPNLKNYDEILLPFLSEIDTNINNLIVLHLKGSHINYHHRYPKQFQKWTDEHEQGGVADYKNSLLYTDYIIETVFNYFNSKNSLDAFVYCSDHGSYPEEKRHPDGSGFSDLRIPLVAYISDQYKENNPNLAKALAMHEDSYFTNDLLFDLMCSILDITSNYFDESQSLGSFRYAFNKNNLVTEEGALLIKEDPFDN